MKPFEDRGEAGREGSRSRTLFIGDRFGGDGEGDGDDRIFSLEFLVLSIFFFFVDLLKKLGRTIEMTDGGENSTGCRKAYVGLFLMPLFLVSH